MKTGILVRDVMITNPIKISLNNTAEECAKKMRQQKVGSLIIYDNDKVVGIITEQGLVHKVIAQGLDPKKVIVKDIMIRDFFKIEPYEDIHDALGIMEKNDVKRLPVMDKGKLVGIITLKSILKLEPDLYDIYTEKLKLNEGKLRIDLERDTIEGRCEICGSYRKLSDINGQLLCRKCETAL